MSQLCPVAHRACVGCDVAGAGVVGSDVVSAPVAGAGVVGDWVVNTAVGATVPTGEAVGSGLHQHSFTLFGAGSSSQSSPTNPMWAQ